MTIQWSGAVLTLNAGSSSLKLALFEGEGESPAITGQVDRIGPDASLQLYGPSGVRLPVPPSRPTTHAEALAVALITLREVRPGLRLAGVGHRIVHGGLAYDQPVLVSPEVLKDLAKLEPFAPLHQPHNLTGVHAAMAAFPGVPQVACFDTAFHRGHPFVNDCFAIPFRYYERGVRRFGFHGLSYEYVSGELNRIAPELAAGRVIVAHLGNGASMCAIQAGRSVASTMGFSALDGLPMGTRCGQIDPGVLLYLLDHEGMSVCQVRDLLYQQSGLLGLSGGLSNDMRTLESAHTPEAARAIDYFVFRAQRELGALAASMGGVDALVFCGGIGEHSSLIRGRICSRLDWMGIAVDPERNALHSRLISPADARVSVMIIPTHEEVAIARSVGRLLAAHASC